MIRQYQKDECIKLYQEGVLTINEIMATTGIRSEQTIYRIVGKPKWRKRVKKG